MNIYYNELKRQQSPVPGRAERGRRARQSHAASRRARHQQMTQQHRPIERVVCQRSVCDSEAMIYLQCLVDAIEISFQPS